jgi:hypothetical protein
MALDTTSRESRRMTADPSTGPSPVETPRELTLEELKLREQYEHELADLRRENADLKQKALVPTGAPFAALAPVRSIQDLLLQQQAIESVIKNFFIEGVHYGELYPGAKKKGLRQVGAEWLMSFFGLRGNPIPLEKIERWDKADPLFHYQYQMELISIGTGQIVATGIGSCNSLEDKFRYRDAERKCPSCGKETIIKGKKEYGGGWVCFAKKGGCGAKYPDGSIEIENQTVGKVENLNIFTDVNSIDKRAQKRALDKALKACTGVSAYFEILEDDDDAPGNGAPGDGPVVEHKPSTKPKAFPLTPLEINELIDYAISLKPDFATMGREKVSNACRDAVGLKSWRSGLAMDLDEAKAKIKERIEKAPKADDKPASTGPKMCVICGEKPAVSTPVSDDHCNDCALTLADLKAK